MARPVKKIDGRSKEARAKRAKTAVRKPRAIAAPARAKAVSPRKLRVVATPELDVAVQIRITAVNLARDVVLRDRVMSDLLPLARQIEEFLTGAAQTAARVGVLSPCVHSPSLDDAAADLRGLRDAEAAFS